MESLDERCLRGITYLAPGLPRELFECVLEAVGAELGACVSLECDPRSSGPMHGAHDPFASPVASHAADVGFLCSPSFLYLRSLEIPSVELVPFGLVFDDPRLADRPVYYSDVIVRADGPARNLDDLRGATFGYNDTCSLSGYYAARQELARRSTDQDYFASEVCTGSHHASIGAVIDGTIDVAAIDSNVLALERGARPELERELRVLESWGPHPIQPIVMRAGLPSVEKAAIARAVGRIFEDPARTATLARFGVVGFAPVGEDHYAEEREALRGLGLLAAGCAL